MTDVQFTVPRFVVSGLGATMLHTTLAYVLIVMLGASAAVGNGAAFCGAALLSYCLNTFWSFGSSHSALRLYRFVAVSMVGCLASAGIAGAIEHAGQPWWAGIAAVVMTVPALTYVGHRYWTYR